MELSALLVAAFTPRKAAPFDPEAIAGAGAGRGDDWPAAGLQNPASQLMVSKTALAK